MPRLPKVPTGKELEDFVAALLQAGGYFVEKNIIERDVEEVLELDAVAMSYEQTIPEQTLIEVKSGDWGFADIFKVAGWMTYLQLQHGAFVVTRRPENKNIEFYAEKAKGLNIKLMVIDDLQKANDVFAANGFKPMSDPLLHTIWRFSLWIERRLVDVLRQIHKSDKTKLGPRRALEYHSLVNHGIFFISDVRERISMLYDAYKQHPRLTLGAASEMAGAGYDPEDADSDNPFIRDAIFDGKHELLQACMYLEHRARLSILKGAVDYLCQKKAGLLPKTLIWKMDLQEALFSILPRTFQDGLTVIEKGPNFRLYPVLWQVFLWGWGGFLLVDREEEEFAELSKQTGLPDEEIPAALEAYDSLFPIPGGWLTAVGRTHCRVARMVPMSFRGIGAFQRLRRHNFEEYSDFGYQDYTTRDLTRWHNSSVAILQ